MATEKVEKVFTQEQLDEKRAKEAHEAARDARVAKIEREIKDTTDERARIESETGLSESAASQSLRQESEKKRLDDAKKVYVVDPVLGGTHDATVSEIKDRLNEVIAWINGKK